MSDAKATAEFVIRDALAETGNHTRLRAGPDTEAVVAKILHKILEPGTRWAFERILEDARVEDPVTEDLQR